MAISVVMHFKLDADAKKLYDEVIDEMGVRDNAPPGAIYHWCAPVPDGLLVCDVWESQAVFDRFAKEQIMPLTSKRGIPAPTVEVSEAEDITNGDSRSHNGAALFVECDGDQQQLMDKVHQASKMLDVAHKPPSGLIFHYATRTPKGLRVIDHWRSREDFERFVEAQLAQALQSVGMPQPRIQSFEVYNTIDPRVTAAV